MREIRRNDLSPRVEMMPLIDVIFLLLTFFIYSLIVTVRAEVLPVKLMQLNTGKPATEAQLQAITLDRNGDLFYNRQPITDADLDTKLQELAGLGDGISLYLAMEAQGTTDRGPALIRLIDRVRAAGIENFVIVGQPQPVPLDP